MFYLIGGSGRSGKSTLRNLLCKQYGIPGISTDLLTQMMGKAVPDYELSFSTDWQIAVPKMRNLIKALLTYHSDTYDLVIEGWQISAADIEIYKEWSKGNLKMCVLGFDNIDIKTKIQHIRNNPSYNEWTHNYSQSELEGLIKDMINANIRRKQECATFGVEYFDTSLDFEETIKDAADYLVNE